MKGLGDQDESRRCMGSSSSSMCAEMEFLDINLSKDSSLLLHAIRSPFYWQILQKSINLLGL
jgi:hypothetical protein